MSDGLNVAVVRDARRAAALIDPVRVAMLERLSEPGSASSLARELGLPRQRVNYHLRELEKARFVEFVEERRRGNCVERLVRATARSYLLSPEILGKLGDTPDEQHDRFSASYLIGAASRLIREVSNDAERAAAAKKRMSTFTLQTEIRFASAEDRASFAEDLANAVARLTAKYHDANASDGRTFKLLTAVYPAARTRAEKGRSS